MDKRYMKPKTKHRQSDRKLPVHTAELPPHSVDTCLACKVMKDLRIKNFNNIPSNCIIIKNNLWCSELDLYEQLKSQLFYYSLTFNLLSLYNPNHIIDPTHLLNHKRLKMAQQLNQDELVSFRELLISNTIQLDTVSRLLIEKGIITDEEFFDKLKEVQMEYKSKDNA